MLKRRIITSLIGLPLLTAVLWFGGPWFTIFVAIWGLLAILEFYRLVAAAKVPPLYYFGLVWTLLLILSPHFSYESAGVFLITSFIVLSLIWLLLRSHKETAFTSWAWTLAGILYVGWLLSYLVALRGFDAGRGWAFLALFCTFGSDSAAFFVGRTWGKRYLAPSISPGKTWEGAIAGIFGAMIVSVGLAVLFGLPLGYGQAILLGFLVSVFGQSGDLAESLFKRNMGAKESGKLIPGHGGVLDRMDSVVFAGVVVYYYVLFTIA